MFTQRLWLSEPESCVSEQNMTTKILVDHLAAFRTALPEKARIYVAGCSGEPLAIRDAFMSRPDLAEGIEFFGIWIPGVNATDWANLSSNATAQSIFISSALRPSFEAGRTHFLPLNYSQSANWLSQTKMDGAIVMISPPNPAGQVSLGVSADFSPLILGRKDVPVFGLINTAMKAPLNGPTETIERFSVVAECDHPLVQVSERQLPATFEQIGQHIAAQCAPGDTLQFGLGNVQQAALKALRGHSDLKIHAGMVSTPLIELLDAGAIADQAGAITTGVAIGTDALYQRVVREDRIRFAPVSETHAIATLARLPRFKAINSCIEVDLFGQANAEFIDGRQISGTGGLVEFLRGAQVSPGGRGILALAATASKGSISRIVPRLPDDATSIARADVDTVITEFGVADLRYKSIDARAEALIGIAAPDFRDELAEHWRQIRKGL